MGKSQLDTNYFIVKIELINLFISGGQMTFRRNSQLIISGLIFSSLIALISFLFLIIEEQLTQLIWQRLPQALGHNFIYELLICLVGGLLVGQLHQTWGDLPQTTQTTMMAFKQDQTVNYQNIWQHLLAATVILIFGAGVGPEAALLSAVIALSVWQADKLRYQYFHQQAFSQVGFFKSWLMRLHPTKYRQTYNRDLAQQANQKTAKELLYTLLLINGLTTFIILMRLTKQPTFITKMGLSQWRWQELWLIIPAIMFGLLFGWLYRHFSDFLQRLSNRYATNVRIKALLGAGVIFVFASVLPRLLFSGQPFLSLVPQFSSQQSASTLFLAAILKLLFLQLCLKTGWIGGDIFPITFAAILLGFGWAHLLPGFDSLLIVAVVAASVATSILRSPIFPSIFIALFFPANLAPVFLIIILIFVILQKLTAKRHQR